MTSPLLLEVQSLEDPLLWEGARVSVSRERGETARVLAHLAEIDRRKLYLQRGFPSLFAYVRESLKYSESSTARRVAAARLVREFPERLAAIAEGRLTLCAAMEAWRVFLELRPRRAAEHKAVGAAKDTAQPALDFGSPAAAGPMPSSSSAPAPLSQAEKREVLDAIERQPREAVRATLQGVRERLAGGRSGRETNVPSERRPRGRYERHSRQWERLELYLAPDERARFDRLRSLLSHAHPDHDPTSVFLRLVEEGLDRYDPARQEERARERARKKDAKRKGREEGHGHAGAKVHCHGDSASVETHPSSAAWAARQRRPAIPESRRRQIRIRDQDGCQYRDSVTGRRCGAWDFLDIDHILPRARGGTDDPENLRLVCASHNRHRMAWE